jgi:acetolactate synthase-1/2/3 large subunit
LRFVLEKVVSRIKRKDPNFANSNKQNIAAWWSQIEAWRKKKSLGFKNSNDVIKPQFAVQRLYELTKAQDVFITTEVGQHQMWAAQHYKFDKPNRWMTSGGLGTMGYGLTSATVNESIL